MPRSHQEIQRLEAEAAPSGGLAEGQLVQLANGDAAVVRQVTDDTARARKYRMGPCSGADESHSLYCFQVVLDCNHPLAGAPLVFTLQLTALERGETQD